MTPNVCSDCFGEMNPLLLRYNHKGHCRSYLPRHQFDNSKWCTRCGSGAKDNEGTLIHQTWCKGQGEKFYDPSFKELKTVSVDGLIFRASKIAAEAHRDMKRKYSGDPYVYHPMRVAGKTMLLMGSTPVEVASAWLHDTLEPNGNQPPPMKAEDLMDRGMPPLVIEMVTALTKPSCMMPKEEQEALKRTGRVQMDHEWYSKQGVWVKKIKMLDRIDNLMDLSWKDKEFMQLYCAESRDLFMKIGDADGVLMEEGMSIVEYYENELTAIEAARDWH